MRNVSLTLEKVKDYAKRFLPGHRTFLCPGSEERDGMAILPIKRGSGIAHPTK